MQQGPRVALVAVGDPRSPDTWSGIAVGVLEALRGLGVAVVPVDLSLPGVLERALLVGSAMVSRNRFDAESAAPTVRARAALAARRLKGARVDGVIQIGTTVALGSGAPYVTLEDMTLRQAAAVHPVFKRMSPGGIAAWEARRAAIYARARMCAVASDWAASSLRLDYGLAPERIAVVGFGANHHADVARRAGRAPRFLFIGVDWERKGGPLLLRAFARLRTLHPDAVLDVVGAHPPILAAGVTGHGVLSLANALGRAQLTELLGQATCFVMPSLVEPLGIVHVEAASVGVPSIASSVGGAREVIGSDGGVLVDPNDEDGLFDAMCRLCDPETARAMGSAAQEHARSYTWTKVAERLLRALGLSTSDGRTLAAFI